MHSTLLQQTMDSYEMDCMQLLSSACHFQTMYSDSGTRWGQKPQQCNSHCYFPHHLLHPEKFQFPHAPETEPNNKLVVSHDAMKSSQTYTVCQQVSNYPFFVFWLQHPLHTHHK
jgi:hypothetical protein